jgi:hypothetical protein
MPWTVIVDHAGGSEYFRWKDQEYEVVDVHLMPSDEILYPLLASIDPYEDASFEPDKIDSFIREWSNAKARFATEEEMRVWSHVHEMGLRAQQSGGRLIFIGD